MVIMTKGKNPQKILRYIFGMMNKKNKREVYQFVGLENNEEGLSL